MTRSISFVNKLGQGTCHNVTDVKHMSYVESKRASLSRVTAETNRTKTPDFWSRILVRPCQ